MRSVKRAGRSCHTMSTLVCGLDVHKDSTYATILNSEGKIVNQTRMSNERVLPYLSHFDVGKVGMESSNQIAPLFRQLTAKGYNVVVCWTLCHLRTFQMAKSPSSERRLDVELF
ncbi:MAG: hypothetical protein ABSE15_09790 [Candidatus Bathyarchaeia archaeon]